MNDFYIKHVVTMAEIDHKGWDVRVQEVQRDLEAQVSLQMEDAGDSDKTKIWTKLFHAEDGKGSIIVCSGIGPKPDKEDMN